MSMAIGIDNRDLTPPFFPVCRNSDGVYGVLAARVCSESCLGYLPYAVIHDPQGCRRNSGAIASLRVSDWVLACLSTWPFHEGKHPVAERLRSLGRHLVETASLAPADFARFARQILLQMASQRAAQTESLIRERGGEPAFWVEDLHRELDAMRKMMVEPDRIAPVDLPPEWTTEQRIEETRSLVRRYGELLSWWPAIVDRAKELRMSGVSLTDGLGSNQA